MKLILFFLVLIFLIVPVNAVDWHDDSRLKRIQLNVDNSSVALTDYQLMKNITYDSDMQPDFDDLLFYNESGGGVPYWIESKTDSSIAEVWLKIPSISTTEGAKVWVYYDNFSASSASSIFNTMIVGDDFNRADAEVVGNGWSDVDSFDIESNQMNYDYVSGTETWKAVTHGTYVYHIDIIPKTSQATRIVVSAGANEECLLRFDNSDNICKYLRGQPSISWIHLGTYVDARKYQIKFTWHNDTNKWDVSVVSSVTDWSASNIDHYDGVVASGTNRFEIDNMGTGVEDVWFDNFYVRKYTTTEPTWGADGEEESYEAPPVFNGTYLYPNSTYSMGYYGRLTSELVYETGINFSDIDTFNLLTTGDMEVLSTDDTNYIPSIDKDAAHDGYMYGNFSLQNVESVNFINVKTVHNRNETNPVILGLFNVSTQKWHAVNNSSVEIVDVELTYNITGTDIIKYTTLVDNVLNLSVSLNTNGDGNYDVFVDFVEVYIDYEESPDITLEYVYNLTISNQNNISILQNDVNDLENNMNNLYLFTLLCTVFLIATLRKRGDQ